MKPSDDDEQRPDTGEQDGVSPWVWLFYVCALLAALGSVWWLVIRYGGAGG